MAAECKRRCFLNIRNVLGPSRSLMSRIFGSTRVTFSPTNSSQAAEADSSDEISKSSPLRKSVEIAHATENSFLEASSIIASDGNSQKLIAKRYSGDEQNPSSVKDVSSEVDGCDRVDD